MTDQQLLLFIYEGGGLDYNEALTKLTEVKETQYARNEARNLITLFLNDYAVTTDNQHPINSLPPVLIRKLVKELTQAAKGNIKPRKNNGPSVF